MASQKDQDRQCAAETMASQKDQDEFLAALANSNVGICTLVPNVVCRDSIFDYGKVLVMAFAENLSTCGLVGDGLLDIAICQSNKEPLSFASMIKEIGRSIKPESVILIMEKDHDVQRIVAEAPNKIKKIVFRDHVPKTEDLSVAEIVLVYKVAGAAATAVDDVNSVMNEIENALQLVKTAHSGELKHFSLKDKKIHGLAKYLCADFDEDVSMGANGETYAATLLMINVFCPLTPSDIIVFTSKLKEAIISHGIKNIKVLSGSFQTNARIYDASISLIRINERMLDLLEAPTTAPFWSNGVVGVSHGSSQGCKSRLKTDFDVKKLLGSGSAGNVYLCENVSDCNQYAIKETVLKEPKKIPIEVVALSTLRHENIVTYNQAWVERRVATPHTFFCETDTPHDKCLYIQMELCNKSLQDIIEDKVGLVFRKKWAWRVFRELTSALIYIHNKGFVHGDLSASNIFFDSGGHVRLADFDMAFYLEKEYGEKPISFFSLDKDEELNETYRAPEVLSGSKLTEKADIFGLGIIAATLFATAEEGKTIYNQQISDARSLIRAGEAPKGLEEYIDLKDFLVTMCAVESSLRPTAAEVLVRLDNSGIELDENEEE